MSATSNRPVCHCGKPLPDNAYLCTSCTGRLARDLGEIPVLVDEVETTRLRLSRTGGQPIGGSRPTERPLPFNDSPERAKTELLKVLRHWTGVIVDQAHRGYPRDLIVDLSRFLLLHLDWLRRNEHAGDAYDQVYRAVGWLRATVDRPADLTYAGLCAGSRACAGTRRTV